MSMALCFEHLPAFASLARRAGIPQDPQDPQESRPLRWIVDSRIDDAVLPIHSGTRLVSLRV